MKCPYCGEEILTVAKKCKHCGEWLEDREYEEEEVDTVIEDEPESDDDSNWEWLYEIIGKIIAVLIFLLVAFFTMPSEEKQAERMKEELRVLVRKDIKNETRNEDMFTQAIGKGMIKDKDLVDELVLQRYSIKVNNYKVFSSITVTEKETGDSRTCGFAAFGIIYINQILVPNSW